MVGMMMVGMMEGMHPIDGESMDDGGFGDDGFDDERHY